MKIVNINSGPSACDEDGLIRRDCTDLNAILDNIDGVNCRNDAIRKYIYALRDLQYAHNYSGTRDYDGTVMATDEDIDKAEAAVAYAFARLTMAELSINTDGGRDWYDWATDSPFARDRQAAPRNCASGEECSDD